MNTWLAVRGGVRSWGSGRDKEVNDEMGQDGSDYISKQSSKQQDKDGKMQSRSAVDGGDKDRYGVGNEGPSAKPRKKHSLFNNIFRLRFVTSLIRKFLQIFISDPDITSIVSRLLSWVIWSYVVLSIMGTCGVGN